jgi:hypothetical protein
VRSSTAINCNQQHSTGSVDSLKSSCPAVVPGMSRDALWDNHGALGVSLEAHRRKKWAWQTPNLAGALQPTALALVGVSPINSQRLRQNLKDRGGSTTAIARRPARQTGCTPEEKVVNYSLAQTEFRFAIDCGGVRRQAAVRREARTGRRSPEPVRPPLFLADAGKQGGRTVFPPFTIDFESIFDIPTIQPTALPTPCALTGPDHLEFKCSRLHSAPLTQEAGLGHYALSAARSWSNSSRR